MSRWAKLADEAIQEMKSPPPPVVVRRKKKVSHRVSEAHRKSVMARWESVQQEQDEWLQPFYKLSIERAMRYLEDLRKICYRAGEIMNQRLSNDPARMRCAGPTCGKDLSGLLPNGRPKWIAKKDFKDREHPEIIHSLFYCSEICVNAWVRKQGGAMGGTQ